MRGAVMYAAGDVRVEERRCVASCPTRWTASGTAESSRARCSTLSCLSSRRRSATAPWTPGQAIKVLLRP
jgi:hypothetical protein